MLPGLTHPLCGEGLGAGGWRLRSRELLPELVLALLACPRPFLGGVSVAPPGWVGRSWVSV